MYDIIIMGGIMDTTSLGFYVKPRLYILENGNVIDNGMQILEKKSKNIDLYYMSDGFFVVKLNNNIIRKEGSIDEIMMNKLNNSLIYTNYANVIYYLFVMTFNRKNLGFHLEIYDIVGDESIIVSLQNDVWSKNGTKGDTSGRLSFNSNCFFPLNTSPFVNKINIEKNIFEKCLNELSNILDNVLEDERVLQTLLLYVNAMINIKTGHFDIGIVLLWTSIENIIDELWEKMLEDSDYNNDLKNKIKKSSEYTVSIKINELFLGKILDLELVKKLDKARKIRNKIIHGQYSLFLNQGDINGTFTNISTKCNIVNMAAAELINHIYDLDLYTSFSIDTQMY